MSRPISLSLFVGFVALAAPLSAADWTNISDPIVKKLEDDGQKFGFSGKTAGVACDPATGDVYMVANGLGIYKSTDQGKSFTRVDGGKIGGRCETSFALNFDPAGKRLACFMLDGKTGWTGDSGQTWTGFTDVGRNWDFAAVDWSGETVKNIFAGKHESGGEVMYSSDGGKTWKLLFKQQEFDRTGGLGIFDEKTLVYTEKGKGIQRSTDAGQTWTKIDDQEPIGRVVHILKGKAYWLAKDGLLVSTDKGATWKVQGKSADPSASIGPFIDPKNEKQLAVAGQKGVFRSNDGGETWQTIAPLPKLPNMPRAGWYTNVVWDPVNDTFYVSHMGQPTFKLDAK